MLDEVFVLAGICAVAIIAAWQLRERLRQPRRLPRIDWSGAGSQFEDQGCAPGWCFHRDQVTRRQGMEVRRTVARFVRSLPSRVSSDSVPAIK